MPHRSNKTWVATFDGQVGRIYALAEDGNLRHLPDEGMDARREERAAGKDGPAAGLPPAEESIRFTTEEHFVKTFTDKLEQKARRGAFDRLIVSADPKSLAPFRKAAGDELKGKIKAELNKDHIHTPVKQLEQALSEHL